MAGAGVTKFEHVALWCSGGHDHLMTQEQADRLEGTPCCWCQAPIRERRDTREARPPAPQRPSKAWAVPTHWHAVDAQIAADALDRYFAA